MSETKCAECGVSLGFVADYCGACKARYGIVDEGPHIPEPVARVTPPAVDDRERAQEWLEAYSIISPGMNASLATLLAAVRADERAKVLAEAIAVCDQLVSNKTAGYSNAFGDGLLQGHTNAKVAIAALAGTPRADGHGGSMKPSIGRIVHYTNLGDRDGKYPPEVQAAIITGVNADGTVALHIFYKTGAFDLPAVQEVDAGVAAGSEAARGKWAWPVREA